MSDSAAALNLDSCSREPIHIPGSIQRHGALLVLDEANLVCLQASANCAEFLKLSSASLPGTSLHALAPEAADVIAEALVDDGAGLRDPPYRSGSARRASTPPSGGRKPESSRNSKCPGLDSTYYNQTLQGGLAISGRA